MKRKVNWLTAKVREVNFTASSIHGDMKHEERDPVMKKFHADDACLLMTTYF